MTTISNGDREGSAAEAAFLEWLNEYTRHEAEPGRTTWDELRAALKAGRANLEDVKGLLGRELQSANAVIMRQMAETEQPGRLEGHINAAEYWLHQADIYNFPDPIRTECLQLAAVHASLAQALALVRSKEETTT